MVEGSSRKVAARARALAAGNEVAREALEFYAAVVEFDGGWEALRRLVLNQGPELLASFAQTMSEEDAEEAMRLYRSGEDRVSPRSFFARILLRGTVIGPPGLHANRCPHCGEPPQCGALRAEGDGTQFLLVCGHCATEWAFPRGQCPACGEKVEFFESEGAHVLTQVCQTCRTYLHVIHTVRDPKAEPLADEAASLVMDVWAREQGWEKLQPNLIGI